MVIAGRSGRWRDRRERNEPPIIRINDPRALIVSVER
jgi:hypothetical protein